MYVYIDHESLKHVARFSRQYSPHTRHKPSCLFALFTRTNSSKGRVCAAATRQATESRDSNHGRQVTVTCSGPQLLADDVFLARLHIVYRGNAAHMQRNSSGGSTRRASRVKSR